MSDNEKCPKCGAALAEVTETATGKMLQRCSASTWDPEARKSLGCDYVKWLQPEPKELDEDCPKCGEKLVMAVTRTGKKMKKCSTNVWNPETKQAEGCDFIEWINGSTEKLNEECPDCGSSLVMFTTSTGKRMKKCSTSGWDKEQRVATGCSYIEWQ